MNFITGRVSEIIDYFSGKIYIYVDYFVNSIPKTILLCYHNGNKEMFSIGKIYKFNTMPEGGDIIIVSFSEVD